MRMTATNNKRDSSSSLLSTSDGSQATNQNHRKSAKSFGARPASGSVGCSSTGFGQSSLPDAARAADASEPEHVAPVGFGRQIVAKKSQPSQSGGYSSSGCGRSITATATATTGCKQFAWRRGRSEDDSSTHGGTDELLDEASSKLSAVISNETHGEDHRKQNHCEIEKRRRDKMNHYIMELASVIPSFNNNQAKFDKLTVLRMAVQHVKSLRSSLCSFSSFHLRPSFLSSGNLLKNLILQMASQEAQDNLFMVVTCDRGKVLFVSQSSKDILNQDQNELVGQCLFDILHKDDVSKVKEQISHYNLEPKEMLVDSRTLQPIKHNQRQSFSQLQSQSNSTPQPGARRSFFFRMKSGRNTQQAATSSSAQSAQSLALPSSFQLNRKDAQAGACSIDLPDIAPGAPIKLISISKLGEGSATKGSQAINREVGCKELAAIQDPPPPSFSAPRKSASNAAPTMTREFNINPLPDNNGRKNSNRRVSEVEDAVSEGSYNRGVCNKPTSVNKSYNKSIENSSSNAVAGKSKRNINNRSSTSISSNCSNSSGIASESQSNEQSSSSNESSSSSSNKADCQMGRSIGSTKAFNNTRNSGGGGNGFSSKKHLRYIVMHCTGYLKSITLKSSEFEDDEYDGYNSENNSSDDEDSSRTVNCLVAVCRRSPINRDLKPDRPLTFTCRYSMEGKFVFVDQRTTIALGYTPQQLLGTSHYAYCHEDSVKTFKECHRQSILKSEPVSSDIYQFKRANGQHLWLQTSLKSFRNPWTKFIDYIVANHTTAEGSDPYYNEGCVPTKFNQDMTGEASQSSSPASSSSLSLPSVDSKKSSSPSSSSNGSSYSMESFASGGSIQALLNQIDRVKSGGVKHSLDLHRRSRGDSHVVRSGGKSTRKSNEDSGNYSDPQSCSSLSSQNSALSSEYLAANIQGINNFGDNNQLTGASNLHNTNLNNSYFCQRMQGSKPAQGLCAPTTDYIQQQQEQQQHQQQTSCQPLPIENDTTELFNEATNNCHQVCTRSPVKATRLSSGSNKQHQRHYGTHYHYRNQGKSGSSTSSDTGNESATWSGSSGSVYSNSSSNHHQVRQLNAGRSMNQASESRVKSSDDQPSDVCVVQEQPIEKTHHHHQHQQQPQQQQPAYVMQHLETPNMNLATPQDCQMRGQIDDIGNQVEYSNEMMTANSYMNQEMNPSYNEDVGLNHMHHMSSELSQQNIPMTMQQQSQQQQQQQTMAQQQQQQDVDPNQINAPMIWTTAENSQYQMNMMENPGSGQMCSSGDVTLMNMDVGNSNNQMIAQQAVQCQQCTNHKCYNQPQVMMNSNTDLNSINLSSLAVDGDLDEDQLLEYLAGCDPEAQLYHIENSAFPQYNIYR